MTEDIDYKALFQQQIKQNEQLLEQNKQLQLLIQNLQEQIEQLLRAKYGKKSERLRKNKLPKANRNNEQPTDEVVSRELPSNLVREEIHHDILDKENTCPNCQISLEVIKPLEREILAFRPATLYVKKHLRHRYACRCCKKIVITAKMPAQVIEKGLADSSLLAQILIDKYQDALPLYRQEQRWLRQGFAIARQTLCDWAMRCAEWLSYLVVEMKQDILRGNKISSDDTVFPIQAPGKIHQGRLWVYVGGGGHAPPIATVYEYTPTRSNQGPVNFLKDFQGYLQADAYAGYDKVYSSGAIIEVACFAHVRRKFVDAYESAEDPAMVSLSKVAIDMIGELYDIERRAKQMTAEQRRYYRRRFAKPKLKCLHGWLRKRKHHVLPKLLLGKAINYTLKHWRAVIRYCSNGILDIDNNLSERAIKPFVIGRKNYLFAGSHDGARAAATIYSIIETCKMFQVNTYDYLSDVLARLPNTLNKDIRQLLPYHWRPPSC